MPPFGPVSRRDLISALRRAGFEGPHSGRLHQFMLQGDRTVWIPNSHSGAIGRELLARVLRQARISRTDWERL
ncbi:MAG: type II toxin-antitoxin system HicA family toxin [Dehalococcoidia bacterium]|nr:type II toxin-antitoxin system HicA family toxin [Dehalococcoidia bacterium]MSQ17728.1 type II toxin-antitoxin system HicA family toxin [Dehalococcoidia bacterium]